MAKKVSIILLFTLAVAILALSAATEVMAFSPPDGLCPPDQGSVGECWERNGVVMEIVPDVLTGDFPVRMGGNSIFKYQVTQKKPWPWTRWSAYQHMWVDLLIKVSDPKLNIINSTPVSLPPLYGLKEDGHGDLAAVFGIKLTGDDTWKWQAERLKDIPKVSFWSLTVKGLATAEPNAALVRRTAYPGYWGFGEILAPVSEPPSEFGKTTFRETNLGPQPVCLEIIDLATCKVRVWESSCENLQNEVLPSEPTKVLNLPDGVHTVKGFALLDILQECGIHVLTLNPCTWVIDIGGVPYTIGPITGYPPQCP